MYNFKIKYLILSTCASRIAKDLSEGVRRQIIALRNEGYSQRQIAAKMGLSKHKRNTRKNNQRNNSSATI
jgi:transposase